jgi:hypothetical protein
MTEEQKLRYELIRNTNNVEKAREFYDFIMGTKIPAINVNCQCEDGIYICYEGGERQLYDGNNPAERVDHIGIKVGTHMVGLCFNSQGERELPYNSDLDKDDFDYKRHELHALDDFNGKANTEHLKRHGEFDFDLADDEWIPSLGELAIICKNKEKINEALAYVSGDELVDDWYWSSTETRATGAWYVGFSNGSVFGSSKSKIYVVRPVCEF